MSTFFFRHPVGESNISSALIIALFTINFSLARTRAYLRKSTRQMSELRSSRHADAWTRREEKNKNKITRLKCSRVSGARSSEGFIARDTQAAFPGPPLRRAGEFAKEIYESRGRTRELGDGRVEMRKSFRVMSVSYRGGMREWYKSDTRVHVPKERTRDSELRIKRAIFDSDSARLIR